MANIKISKETAEQIRANMEHTAAELDDKASSFANLKDSLASGYFDDSSTYDSVEKVITEQIQNVSIAAQAIHNMANALQQLVISMEETESSVVSTAENAADAVESAASGIASLFGM